MLNLEVPGARDNYKFNPLSRSQTKAKEDVEILEMYSDLSHLSSKRFTKKANDSFTKMSSESKDILKNKKSKALKHLKSTIQNNSRLSYEKEDGKIDNKAKKDSKKNPQSISSISVHSSINIDPDEVRKPMKRFQTNSISVNNLSEYKFFKK